MLQYSNIPFKKHFKLHMQFLVLPCCVNEAVLCGLQAKTKYILGNMRSCGLTAGQAELQTHLLLLPSPRSSFALSGTHKTPLH